MLQEAKCVTKAQFLENKKNHQINDECGFCSFALIVLFFLHCFYL